MLDVLAPMDILLFAIRIIVGLHVLTVMIMNGRILATHRITITHPAWDGQVSLVIGVDVVVGKQKLSVIKYKKTLGRPVQDQSKLINFYLTFYMKGMKEI